MFCKILLQNPNQYWHNAFSLDWVLVGKEIYGNRSTYKTSLKSGAKIFDALGKAYRKIKSQIKCFVRKSDIEKTERVYAVEFEVYKKVIQDDEGNVIAKF